MTLRPTFANILYTIVGLAALALMLCALTGCLRIDLYHHMAPIKWPDEPVPQINWQHIPAVPNWEPNT